MSNQESDMGDLTIDILLFTAKDGSKRVIQTSLGVLSIRNQPTVSRVDSKDKENWMVMQECVEHRAD